MSKEQDCARPVTDPAIGIQVVLLAFLALVAAWLLGELLLLFTGVLLAVFLRGVSSWLARRIPLGETGALLIVVVLLVAMLVVGLATYAGLWALGLPLALTLSLIASALTFIPNIGPVVAAVPATLIGLVDGPRTAGLVAALCVGIQTVESYLITPLIQRRAVSLPPALTIAAQVLLGVTAGAFGLLVATPLTAAGMVAIEKLYVERE